MSDETMSDFLKCAYQIGKIKDVSEAFDEFNPEEEIHKGKTEFWLKEKAEQILFKIGKVDYEKIEEYKKYYLNQNKS